MAQYFGEHLMIDGYGGDRDLLNSEQAVLDFLTKLPEDLGMHTLTKGRVVNAPDNGLNDPGGWSGFVIIAESHISVHTFPRREFVSVDVYTCKPGLDTKEVERFLKESFKLKELETNFVIRGKKYPEQNIHP